VDQAHKILSSKINPKINYSGKYAKRLLGFLVIKSPSTNFQEDPPPPFSKIILDIVLATSKNYK
jgi:hypothetical protein